MINCLKKIFIAYIFCLFLGLIILSNSLFSQTYNFANYSVEQGLVQSKVFAVYQDSEGYMWFGTEGGVSKFNGKTFENFTTEEGLKENAVTEIFQDKKQRIWFGHIEGSISVMINDSIQKAVISDATLRGRVFTIFQDSEGSIWFGAARSGAVRISEKDSLNFTGTQFSAKESLGNDVFDIWQDTNGSLYFFSDLGIKKYLKEKNTFETIAIKGLPYFPKITSVLDNDEDILFGTIDRGLIIYNKSEKSSWNINTGNGLPHNWITTIAKDKNQNVIAGTWGGGAIIFDSYSAEEELKFDILNTDKGICNNKIWSIKDDSEGNLWIGTNEGGVSCFKGKRFITYDKKTGFDNEVIWSIFQDSNNSLWFGTNEGIFISDPKKLDDKAPFIRITQQNGLLHNQVMCIKEDKENNVWLGTWGGVSVFNLKTNKIQNYSRVDGKLVDNYINTIEFDDAGNAWVGTISGITRINLKTDSVKSFNTLNGLSGNNIATIFKDSKGNIWIGTRGGGLMKYNQDGFIHYSRIQGLNHNSPTSVVEDKSGNLWIGTEGGGLFVFDGVQFVNFKTRNGLLSDFVNLVIADKKNNIWIGTGAGLNKYNQIERKFYDYGKQEGFKSIESKSNAVLQDSEGNIWFGTNAGVVKYQSKFDNIINIESPVHLTSFKVLLKETNLENNLSLKYDQNHVTFYFTSPCFSNPDKVLYSFRLQGMDEDFMPPTQQTFAAYSNLPSGDYTFQVKARNHLGLWSSKSAAFSFSIKPPFWKTWWFYAICAIIAILIIYIYVKLRIKKLQEAKKILEEKVTERTLQLDEQNKKLKSAYSDIQSSIRYAKRIQEAILPYKEDIFKELPNSFIFYKPKDIVSGDFYWFTAIENGSAGKQTPGAIILGVCDCTGHGVPGAFMSIIGNELLNKIVNEQKITEPSKILNNLHEGVRQALHQYKEESHVRDGMDIALCKIDLVAKKVIFSGAHRPIYVFKSDNKNSKVRAVTKDIEKDFILLNDEILFKEFKADKYAIGGLQLEKRRVFNEQQINIQSGDTLYLFTDGFTDQFGGSKNRKYMSRRFRDFILSIQSKSMKEQSLLIEKELEDWKADFEQTDDILIIGIKI